MAPLVTVVIGCLFAYLAHAEDHGIQIVGHLKKGINPSSIHLLNFDSKYLPTVAKAGIVTGLIALAEGIAIGRSFAIMKNEQIDGNKEMIAFGFMNIVGSLTSCYLTTGPFSKTAVNFNAGCRTAMSNVVMAIFMGLTLLFLAPLFSYTPLVALSAIIMSAMFGLIKYEEAYHLLKVDKFDFVICMAAFLGVSFVSMDVGLMLSVGLGIIRALLYVARPATCKLGKVPNSILYRDFEQYPGSTNVPGILVLQLGSPIYFANCTYIRERILRWIREEQANIVSKGDILENVFLDLTGVTSIDVTGIETLIEVHKTLQANDIKMAIINPRTKVMEKMITSKFVDTFGKKNIFLSIDAAIDACRFSLHNSKQHNNAPIQSFVV
ncbi:probable sulfate transporter 3.5 [Quercus suber]|uniref:probable sulfate transporter 3.5 n=1 Tax=Quercus suber TaxID=58331 RepID=UPI0032DF2370